MEKFVRAGRTRIWVSENEDMGNLVAFQTTSRIQSLPVQIVRDLGIQ
jgi:hypothetical protein